MGRSGHYNLNSIIFNPALAHHDSVRATVEEHSFTPLDSACATVEEHGFSRAFMPKTPMGFNPGAYNQRRYATRLLSL